MSDIIKTLYDSIDTKDFLSKENKNIEIESINKLKNVLDNECKGFLEDMIQIMLKNNDIVCFELYERGLKDGCMIKELFK
jgi:hypothetical protein